MTDIDFNQAVEDFWQASQGGAFPVQWQDSFDRETAYRICLAMIARRAANGDPQAGWKVGLTAKAIREQQGASEPVFAVLYDKGRWQSGVSHPYADLMHPGWENELCLTMGASLSGPDVTEEEAKAVVGAATPYDPAIHDLAESCVDLYVNGEFQEKAYGVEILESSPIASIRWLAGKLAEFGLELKAGSAVMTGSFTKQYRFEGPVEIEARFEPFGTGTATFT